MTLPIERITTVLAAAASFDLTDLDTAKDELGIDLNDNSADSWLERALTQVSKSIQRHCKRPFAPEYLQDVIQFGRDPAFVGVRFGGENELALARWPLLAVVSVIQSLPNGDTRTLVAGTDFLADLSKSRLLRLSSAGRLQRWEALPVTVTYTAGYGALVQETDTVPAVAPFQVRVSQAPTFSCDQGVAYASGTPFTPVAANPAQGQYVAAAGIYSFNPADAARPLGFSYATLSVPEDLVEIVLRLITARYQAKDRDPLLIQEDQPALGTRRWWFDTSQTSRFPPDIQDALEDYRVPTLA